MSILIKGAKMPKGCEDCSLNYDYYICEALGDKFDDREEIDMETQRLSDCPLVEIPPHGDLIDRDKLKNDIPETDADCFENCRDCTLLHQEDVWDVIDDVPTVIESEVEE